VSGGEQRPISTAEVREAFQATDDGVDFKSVAERRGQQFDEWLSRMQNYWYELGKTGGL
jgi:hypothetical protein